MNQGASGPGGPRSDRPLRRSFTPAEKLDHLAAYEAACERNQGGAYLRSEGLFSSQMTEWRKLRDAGVLAGKKAGERVGRLSPEQAEIARLRRQLDQAERRLATTEAALDIMGNLSVVGRLWSREKGRSGAVGRRLATEGDGDADRVQTLVGCLG